MTTNLTPPVADAQLPTRPACIRCAYLLEGLPENGKCPECGTPVELSLRGPLLRFATSEYVRRIGSGLSMVLNGILLVVILSVAGAFLGIFARGVAWLPLVLVGLGALISGLLLFGYWRFSDPDPAYAGSGQPDQARRVLRAAVCVQAATQLAQVVLHLTGASSIAGVHSLFQASSLSDALVGVAVIGGNVAWLVQFFAVMQYMRWIAGRIPDASIVRKCGTYMWLLPVIAVLGAVVVIGPLIALVMYWNLLDRVRKAIKVAIRHAEAAEAGGFAVGTA